MPGCSIPGLVNAGGGAMERLVGKGTWMAIFGSLAGVPPAAAGLAGLDPRLDAVLQWSHWWPFLVGLGLFLIYWKPFWRLVWRWPPAGRILLGERYFPDLNGEWDVTLRSNWPVIEAMKEAARQEGAPAFEPAGEPKLLEIGGMSATIDQGFGGVSMRMQSKRVMRGEASGQETGRTVIDESHTIAFDLIPATREERARLAYVYRQHNNRAAMDQQTDEANFLGAAMLEVCEEAGEQVLRGVYMTNRSWPRGLNPAGEIEMRRRAGT